MENKATNILELKINELKDTIVQNKISIAELFIKIQNSKFFMLNNSDSDCCVFNDMNEMHKYTKELSDNETKLQILIDIKYKIENSESIELEV